MKKFSVLVAMVMAVAAGSAFAHGIRPKFGGVVQATGNVQFELINNIL